MFVFSAMTVYFAPLHNRHHLPTVFDSASGTFFGALIVSLGKKCLAHSARTQGTSGDFKVMV